MRKTGKIKNQMGPTASLIKNSAIGSAVGLICCILFSFVAAFLVSVGDLGHRSVMPIAMAIIALSSFIGAVVSARLHRRQGLLLGALVAFITFAVLMLAGIFVPDEALGANLALKALLVLIPSIVGAVLGVNIRRKY